jgi:hypothetical protein
VIGSLLVARVEVVDTTEDDPERQGQSEEDDLGLSADPVVLGVDVRREEHLRQGEREQDAGRVRKGERAAHEPSTAMDALASLLDQLARAVVDEVEQPYPRGLVDGGRLGSNGGERLVGAHTVSSSFADCALPLLESVSARPLRPSWPRT